MKVIDSILREWSYRCSDGIVDMNNPVKFEILNKILKEYNLLEEEQSIDDKINAIVSSLEKDEKEKIYKILVRAKNKIKKIEGEEDIKIKNIKQELIKKQIPDSIIDYIILKIEKQDQIDELIELINSISLTNLREKENQNLKNEAGNLAWINDIAISSSKSLSIGKGEFLLAIMIREAKLINEKGADLEITNRKVEIKQSSETGGAIISQSGRSSGYKNTWTEEFKDKWNLTGDLLSTWSPIYNRFTSLSAKEKRDEFIDDINNLIKNQGFDPLPPPQNLPQNNPENFYKLIASLAVKDYLNNKDLILMNNNLDYTILNNKEQILSNNEIKANSAFIPRIFYKGPPVDESKSNTKNISELANTGHFQLRLGERGNVLDILNLGEIPLGDYKFSEVKEKLKANISEELKTRATNILSKDIPTSNTYDIGIKVLKPVLVVDNKKYPLKLFAISTKEIKDKEGNVVEIVEVENRGTLYFATIADNKATTLMLLDKEDDNELYFQIKDHVNRKKGEGREAKILAPPNYIYEIDLDELMGNKADQEPTLIDPNTLDYELKAAYKPKSKFVSKSKGEGTIIAASVSGQRSGEPDGNGVVDWVDVEYKFDKPKLKNGKLVYSDIIRYNPVFTTSYKKLKK